MSNYNAKLLKEALATAQIRYIVSHPFWAMLCLHVPLVESTAVERMGTDGVCIYYNPEWTARRVKETRYSANFTQFVIAHELYHILMRTKQRCGGRDKDRWNIASDYIINRDLKLEFGSVPSGLLYAAEFDDPDVWYTEKVYAWIEDNHKRLDEKAIEITLPEHGYGENKTQRVVQVEAWDNDDLPMFPGMSRDQAEEARKEFESRAIQAYQSAKVQGQGHGYLRRFVKDLLAPKLPWRALLSDFVSTFAQDDYSYSRRDPTYEHTDIIMPSLFNLTLQGVVAVDTSGSISVAEAQQFISEITGITSAFPGSQLTIMFVDQHVHDVQQITTIDELDLKQGFQEGGGGTSFIPVFQRIQDDGMSPTFLAYLTDGYGSYPERDPGYSTMWVLNNESYNEKTIPFGKVIRMVD